MPYLPSPGRCIYCGSDPTSDEHIVPNALGGRLVLTAASCESCRRITSEFERVVTREMYWPLRLSLGVRGSRKHKAERPKHWTALLEDGESIAEVPIKVEEFPKVYSVLEFDPPGLIEGRELTELSPPMRLHLKGDTREMAALVNEHGAGKLEVSQELQWAPFARMIAKICHAYAVSQIGLEGIEFYLPPLILGKSDYLGHYIGGLSDPAFGLAPPNDCSLALHTVGGMPHLIGRTTIFGNNRFPTYETIIGRILNIGLVSQKIEGALHR